ncbi:GNAT family N-acetyltransferase [Paenibacillus nasutitermitis]|uniref:N-acetyltransferase domain-containing protein n=1 Tax=Paenibacillus nasutitermitis TaxID=1652958 RepID=A0A916ZC20_9BACL|nr:GNAT family N-acetyltransferase [Paenibacillus nasutitermitis]GGD87081.1 hypothetical protein GCM10010911_51890 [Paenibacillus nasutitermitis]
MKITVCVASDLNEYDLTALLHQSMAEGYRHISRLVNDYADDSNRFDRLGEALFVAIRSGSVIAVGGLNMEVEGDIRTGRVRRVYVARDCRRLGAGRLLMEAIIDFARLNTRILTLRTSNPAADLFYRSLGFEPESTGERITHRLLL